MTIQNAREFLKRNLLYVIYAAVGVVTAAMAIGLLAWTISGDKELVSEVLPATVVCEREIQTEYLVGQKFNTAGISINIGTEQKPEIISADECTVNADFTAAGKNVVEIIYQVNDFTSYRATIQTDVIFVRSMEIAAYPEVIQVGENNSVTTDDKFEMYATLATRPQSEVFGQAERTDNGYRIKLDESVYTVTCVPDRQVQNLYGATFYCGDVSQSFNFYNAAGRSFIVSSSKNIVPYSIESGTADTALTLVVTDRDDSYQLNCTGQTKGFYVYRNALGEERTVDFDYALTDKAENFDSDGILEATNGSFYTAKIDGNVYKAEAAVWQSAVVQGIIYEDHGFKIVIDSDRRILNFTLNSETLNGEPADTQTGTTPTLTLYTTKYDMNPMLGTGNGYAQGVYIFTARNGEAYKVNFYMQAFSWSFAPMSAAHGDGYSDVSVSDVVYNPDAPLLSPGDPQYNAPGDEYMLQYNSYYLGTLHANISVYARGEGFKNLNFTAVQELWLGAIMGM